MSSSNLYTERKPSECDVNDDSARKLGLTAITGHFGQIHITFSRLRLLMEPSIE